MSAASNRYNEKRRQAAMEALKEKPGLVNEIAELNAQIATLIKVVQDRDGEIVQLKKDVSDLFRYNTELEERVAALEAKQ